MALIIDHKSRLLITTDTNLKSLRLIIRGFAGDFQKNENFKIKSFRGTPLVKFKIVTPNF
jgi:hypothetical protein